MLVLHGATGASRRAFSILVMLALDETSFSLEGKVVLCAVVAMAPLFPPRKASAVYMREVENSERSTGPILSRLRTALATRWHYVSGKRGLKASSMLQSWQNWISRSRLQLRCKGY